MSLLARHYNSALHESHTIATEGEQEPEQLDTFYQQEGKHGDDSPSVYADLETWGGHDE